MTYRQPEYLLRDLAYDAHTYLWHDSEDLSSGEDLVDDDLFLESYRQKAEQYLANILGVSTSPFAPVDLDYDGMQTVIRLDANNYNMSIPPLVILCARGSDIFPPHRNPNNHSYIYTEDPSFNRILREALLRLTFT